LFCDACDFVPASPPAGALALFSQRAARARRLVEHLRGRFPESGRMTVTLSDG
jgi:hypothetical protein